MPAVRFAPLLCTGLQPFCKAYVPSSCCEGVYLAIQGLCLLCLVCVAISSRIPSYISTRPYSSRIIVNRFYSGQHELFSCTIKEWCPMSSWTVKLVTDPNSHSLTSRHIMWLAIAQGTDRVAMTRHTDTERATQGYVKQNRSRQAESPDLTNADVSYISSLRSRRLF